MIEAKLIDSMGSDLSVVNAARVSFGKKSDWNPNFRDEKPLYERDAKLIKYLAKHKHLSPFGHAFASFHVKAPIFVARQLVKHKFLRWNEISRRYVDDEPEFYTPDVWRAKADDVKQGSVGKAKSQYFPTEYLKQAGEEASQRYHKMISQGVCAEQARMILPQNMMTEFYWSGSLDAFAAMCRLRCAPDTQYESRLVANPISDIMAGLFPVSWDALTNGETE
jgi:thymidylate synthase (FAD)